METDAIKARVQAQFARTAANYVTSVNHATGDDLGRLVALAAPTANDLALDIATGGGHTALAVARAGSQTIATDFTAAMLRTARTFITASGTGAKSGAGEVQYALADAERLPFADRAFTLVTTRIAPHHFPNPQAYIREVARVLLPGGRFLLEDSVVPEGTAGDFLNMVEKIRDHSHVRSLALREWVTLLENAEFTVQHVELFRKTHGLSDWIARADADETTVRAAWNDAPPNVRDAFDMEIGADGRVVSYSDDKALILAIKPEPTY